MPAIVYIFIFLFVTVFFFKAFQIIKEIKFVKEFEYKKIFNMIAEWYDFIEKGRSKNRLDTNKLKLLEDRINKAFETKVMKTSTLLFTESFIAEFLFANEYLDEIKADVQMFEKISRIELKKSKQSLKLFSLALGVKFSLDNYSFHNYWNILKGNHTIFFNNRTDQTGKKYVWRDIEEPYKVLKYYINNAL